MTFMYKFFTNKKTINYLLIMHKRTFLIFKILKLYIAKKRCIVMFFNVLDKMLGYLYVYLIKNNGSRSINKTIGSLNIIIFFSVFSDLYTSKDLTTSFMLLPILFSTRTNINVLTKKSMLTVLIKRNMFSYAKKIYTVLPKNTIVRQMAVHTGNKPEIPSGTSDPLGLTNNPEVGLKKLRHVEKHTQTCAEDPSCKTKACTTLCGTPKERYASLHLTHAKNNPVTPQGSLHTLSADDYKGNKQTQKAVIYTKATKTAATPEDIDATKYLNRPDIKQKTEPYENIP